MTGADRLVRAVEAAASDEGFVLDPSQTAVLNRMASLGAALAGGPSRRGRGLYVHGDVGRGKSWLADAFYTALPTRRKTRVHFHGFFDRLHRSIHAHRDHGDAVERAIDEVLGDSRLLYFDELHVHDPGDARLLTRLLDHVFARNVTVIATSNYAPDDLLPDPIWHHIFEPGIALIKTHMEVQPLRGPTDYRTMRDDHSQGFAASTWSTTDASDEPLGRETLDLHGRIFAVTSTAGGALTATFAQLCDAPTSTIEFLRWSRDFPRWSITGVPPLSAVSAGAQQRLINLIDVLVEADVTVRFSASVGLEDFLSDASTRPDAFRMASRLRLVRDEARVDA